MTKIHVVSFDIPLPANYGGVVDVLQHLKMFKKMNIEVVLHCFHSNRIAVKQLENYCSELFLYPRKSGLIPNLSLLPYIVNSRKSEALLKRLVENKFPIFYEGIHSCETLNNPLLSKRVKFVRTHNVEQHYYEALAKTTKSIYKKMYFKIEAMRLKRFETTLKNATALLTVTDNDQLFFKKINSNSIIFPNTLDLDSFEHERIMKKDAIVFHGNLAVSENEIAARWIAKNIAQKIDFKILIVGKDPSEKLKMELENRGIIVVGSPSNEELSQILGNAKIHLLPTFQDTGAKNKNLRALASGGICLVNKAMLAGTDLHEFVEMAETPEEFISKINSIMKAELADSNQIEKLRNKFGIEVGIGVIKKLIEKFV